MLAVLHATELTPRVRNAPPMRPLLACIALFIVLCPVVALATDSKVGTFISIMFGGTAFVLLIAAAFLAVGESEDRARVRDAAERAERDGNQS